MSLQTKRAREWIDANPTVVQVNVNAYVAMIEHAEEIEERTATDIVTWLRACNAGSLRVACLIELMAQWVETTYGTRGDRAP